MTLAEVRPPELTRRPTNPAVLQRLGALLDRWDVHREVDGAVVGTGRIRGTEVVAFATDPSVQGGALGAESCAAIAEATGSVVVDPDRHHPTKTWSWTRAVR